MFSVLDSIRSGILYYLNGINLKERTDQNIFTSEGDDTYRIAKSLPCPLTNHLNF